MCGIAGFFRSARQPGEYSAIIRRMLAGISHRGPDEAGYYMDNHAALGTTRLSIIDLHSGTQPLSDPGGRYWICFNGELYNYVELRHELKAAGNVFRTSSDTEVVLQAWIRWGADSLPKFNGPFAFAVYDTRNRSLFLARDRYGKRPLFYSDRNGEFLFASEMKAFFGYEGFEFELDHEQITSMLAVWTPLPEQTGFRHIRQLPMGEYLVVGEGVRTRKRYISLDLAPHPFNGTEADAVDRIRETLAGSVNLRLRSDVPVGIYLSGGLDSAIVTHLVKSGSNSRLRTFSVEFEADEFDESRDQRELVRHFGTDHSSLCVTHRDIVQGFPEALFHAEVPVFRTAFVPLFLLSKTVKEAGFKVVLTGEGADECFLGYDIFKETWLRTHWNELDNEQRRSFLARIYPYIPLFDTKNLPYLMGLYRQYSEEGLPGLFSHEMRFQNGLFSTRLLKSRHDPFAPIVRLTAREESYAKLDTVRKAQWLEFKTLLAGYLLSTQGDRMALAHGVENRCPFLDPAVAELSASLNRTSREIFNEKHFLKEAFRGRLPVRTLEKGKQPYRAPDSICFSKSPPDYLELLLSESELKNTGFLNVPLCKALVRNVMSPTSPDPVSAKEDQAFIFLVSLVLIHRFFTKKETPPGWQGRGMELNPAREVDERRTDQ